MARPVLAHAGWMTFYAAACLAIVLMLRTRLRPFTPSLWLDGLIAELTLGALGAALVLDGLETADVLYSCADLALLATVLWACSMTCWRGGRTWWWLSGAFAVAAIGDLAMVSAGHDEQSLLSAAFPLAMVALAVAATQPSASARALRADAVAVLVLPSVCVVVVLGLLFGGQAAGIAGSAHLLALAALSIAFVRGALTYRELRELNKSRRFQRGFEEATIGMAIAGPDLHWIRVNAALGELLGYEVADLVGRCALDLTHPDDRAISVNLHDGVIGGSQPAPLEKRLIHRDGSAIPVLLTTALIDGEDGVHFFTQLQDLRDRHRADRFGQAVAEVSRVALEVPDVTALMRQVVEIVQEAVGGDSCGVVMTHGSEGPLRVVARDNGITGEEPTLPRGTGSQAGYTLAVDETVVSNDLEDERRFTTVPEVLQHGLRRGLTAPVRSTRGDGSAAVLSVHRTALRPAFGPRTCASSRPSRTCSPPRSTAPTSRTTYAPRAARLADRAGEPRVPRRAHPAVARRRGSQRRTGGTAAARPRSLQGRQ